VATISWRTILPMCSSLFIYWDSCILVLAISCAGDKHLTPANRLPKKVHPKETIYHRPVTSHNNNNYTMLAVKSVRNNAGT